MRSLIADTFANSQRNPNRGPVAQGPGDPAAGAVGVLGRIPKDRIVETEEEAKTLARSLVKRP